MIQKYNTYRVMKLFFDRPGKIFHLREISRLLNLGMPSVKLHIKRLQKEELIEKRDGDIYPGYSSSHNKKFRLYKRNDILLRIQESGLVDFLVDNLTPDAIVIFGSASRGEDIENSDIDIFVVAKEKDIKMKKYENLMKRKINMLAESSVNDVPKELLNNIINGIVLYGYLDVLK
ncbi:MAG: nucleotidyltransferase domain-containing protein [Candidatus Aenigmarchaeota archaeon]|nr:nucleotidyltransferase domain-containing protein [Candidatus Aenigmarchaeota archaeon]